MEFSGFTEDHLPFKYLGMQICSKKLNKEQCNVLVERIIARIRRWGSKTMSYQARSVLVNAVLLSMQTYWASIFIIPKTVINQVMGICRNFRWDGRAIFSRAPPISWDIACRLKNPGGLGI